MFRTITESVEACITEKKSKFICNIYHVEKIDEVENILEGIRKKYHDARHNCYAYKIMDGNMSRFSDDGEPSGTAGMPIMNILNGNNLSNVLVVVTRYFGGILLGTGGLVRAYSEATLEALKQACLVSEILGLEAEFFISYKEVEELKYHLKNKGISITNMEYFEKVKVIVRGSEEAIIGLKDEKLSDRIVLEEIKILGKRYISVKEN